MEEQVAAGFTLRYIKRKLIYIKEVKERYNLASRIPRRAKTLRRLRAAYDILLRKKSTAVTKSQNDFGFLYLENRISKNQTK